MKRRDVLTGAAKLGALSMIGAPFVARAEAAKTVTIVGWGGSSEEQEKKYWYEPFTAETGISVVYATGPDLPRVKAQVESKNILWDIYEGSNYTGEMQGLWEPIDFKIIDPDRFAVKPPSWGVADGVYTGGIGYDPSRTKNPPKNFAEFWDVKNFPGRRALRGSRPAEILEIALVADGVAPSELYPLDVDRAFKSLDRIKPHVSKWFTATAEGVSLIQRNEADYTYTYTNRVKVAKDAGISVDISMDQNLILPEYFSVLKGSPHKEAAMRLLEFITRPEQQANMHNEDGAASTTKGVEQRMGEKARRWLPDLKSPKTIFYDYKYWGDHQVELEKRFKEWLLT